MEKRIYVPEKAKSELRKIFGCSKVQVWKALTYESNSLMARKIRHTALRQFGGVCSWDAHTSMDTLFDESRGEMVQRFGDHVRLVVSRSNDDVCVYVDDVLTRREEGQMRISDFMLLQREVSQLAMSL